MNVQWYGQSTFHLTAPEASVTIDPFADMSGLASRGVQFDYPPIVGLEATLLLVTHEHVDHNGVEAIGGDPTILRSTAGRLDSPIGEVIAIASEHDDQAGTARGPNTIFVFELDGLFIPVGGGPTIGGEQAADIVARLRPRWVVPMRYRTPRIGFLDTADAFLERSEHVERLPEPAFDTALLPAAEGPLVVVPAAP